MNDLLKSIMISKDTLWVVQKYIERPLTIISKKFDIRQWVLITSVEPLRVWIWRKPYFRFSSNDYDPNNLKSKFAHLTNASISETNPNQASRLKAKDGYVIKENMWHAADFKQFVANEYGD
jgi:tubulin monoglycylase TTLL3/8